MATSKLRLITISNKSNVREDRALSMNLNILSGRYIAPGARIMTQSTAIALPGTNRQAFDKQHKPSLFVRKSLSSPNHQLKLLEVNGAA